jgi:hypothetical protein
MARESHASKGTARLRSPGAHRHPWVRALGLLAIAALFVLAGDRFVLQRQPGGGSAYLTVRGDTEMYVTMIEGRGAEVPEPYRHRVLVPWMARRLPTTPLKALKTISYASAFLAYAFVLGSCRRLKLSHLDASVGLLAVWVTSSNLDLYYNPFLTDAFGLLALSVMVFALLGPSFWIFLAGSVAGVVGREISIVLAPAWFATKHVRQAVLVLGVGAAALLAPRWALGVEGDLAARLVRNAGSVASLYSPSLFFKSILLSCGCAWVTALAGIGFIPRAKFLPVAAAFGCLFLGALGASFVARDTERIFLIIVPVLALGTAQLFGFLRARGARAAALAIVALAIAQGLVAHPNRLFGEESAAQVLRMPILLLGLVYGAGLVVAFRSELGANLRLCLRWEREDS